MSRLASLAVPVLTFLVVAFAVLVAGVPRPVLGARVYGGPTEGLARLSLRIVTIERNGEHERSVWNGPLTIRLTPIAQPSSVLEVRALRATLGVADVIATLPQPLHGPVALEIRDAGGARLASGQIELGREQWLKRARRRGGWVRGRASGDLVVSVAPARGAFVIGSIDSLWIRVQRSGQPAAGIALAVSADGARIDATPARYTDKDGRAQLDLEPTEMNPTVRVQASGEAPEGALIETALALVPGAFHALPTPSGVLIETAVSRDEAFYSVISESARLEGGVLKLQPDGHGGSFGLLKMAARATTSWIVVSSDVDQSGSSAVGWPLDAATEPSQTLDVPDALLLDGLPAAFTREAERRSRVRWLSAAFIALAFVLSVVLLVKRVRDADRDIVQHLRGGLDPDTVARVAPRRLLSVLLALCSIGLAFLVVALVLLSRAR